MKKEVTKKFLQKNAYQGYCLCGAVKFLISGNLRDVVNCHCRQCLHTHGHYGAYTSVEKRKIHFVKNLGLKWFQSSNEARRGFCKECGASIFWERSDSEFISIAAGMLDTALYIKTNGHIFFSDKPSYYEILDDLPKFPQASEGKIDGSI